MTTPQRAMLSQEQMYWQNKITEMERKFDEMTVVVKKLMENVEEKEEEIKTMKTTKAEETEKKLKDLEKQLKKKMKKSKI